LDLTGQGKVRLRLKTSWANGVIHLEFTSEEWLEKLAALVPPPRSHLVHWGAVFAPHAEYREKITLNPKSQKRLPI
jgi:hypothetical protein